MTPHGILNLCSRISLSRLTTVFLPGMFLCQRIAAMLFAVVVM
jgi:hypothetical protein